MVVVVVVVVVVVSVAVESNSSPNPGKKIVPSKLLVSVEKVYKEQRQRHVRMFAC